MNELTSRFSSEGIKWYALISGYEGMREELFSVLDDHEYEPLYLMTALDILLESSPIFLELKSEQDPLISELPEQYTLYFSAPSELSFNYLVGHLRARLNILFDGMRKGILHYYHPLVASYFFGRASEKDTSEWLGPFTSVMCLSQCFDQLPVWQELGDGTSKHDDSTWLISLSQDQALTEQFNDQEIAQWALENRVDAYDWEIQRGATRFCEQLEIESNDLRVRLRNVVHHHQVNPRLFNTSNKQFSELDVTQKIEFIEKYLAKEY